MAELRALPSRPRPPRAPVVADICEALTANRPYRPGMPVEKALAILERERGVKLDGDAIDALAAAVSGADGHESL